MANSELKINKKAIPAEEVI